MISQEMLERKLKEYTLKFVVDAKAEHYTRTDPVIAIQNLYCDLYNSASSLIRHLDITADFTSILHDYLIFLFYTKIDMYAADPSEPVSGIILAMDRLHGEKGTDMFISSSEGVKAYTNKIPLSYMYSPANVPDHELFARPFEWFALVLYNLSDKPFFFKDRHMRNFTQCISYIHVFLLEWMNQSGVFTEEVLAKF